MQLSLSSAPTDSAAGLLPTPSAPGASTSTPSDGDAPAGFAQLLAGVAPAAGPTTGANPAATIGDIKPPVAASGSTDSPLKAPAANAPQTGTIVGEIVLSSLAQLGPSTGRLSAPVVAGPTAGKSATQNGKTEQKSPTELADLQALAVLAALGQPLPPPVVAIAKVGAGSTSDVAGAGAAGIASVATGLSGGAQAGPRAIALGSLAGGTVAQAGQPTFAGRVGAVLTPNSNAAPSTQSTGTVAAAPTPNGAVQDSIKVSATGAVANSVHAAIASDANASEPRITPPAGVPIPAQNSDGTSTAASTPPTGIQPSHNLPNFLSDAATTPGGVSEKIAAVAAEFSGVVRDPAKGVTKSFVAAQGKAVTQPEPGVGITGAKPDATMPLGSTLAHPTATEPTAALAPSAVSQTTGQGQSLPQSVTLTSTAHRAVEAALSAADRFASRDQHSVNLQFTVGGSDLNVRVELRQGQVHTTFRTDSSELRAALSNEWNSVTQQSNDRPVRLAAAVFTTNDHAGSSFGGDGASRQRDPQSRAGQDSSFASHFRSGQTTDATTVVAPTPTTRSTSVNSVHLHTLA